MRKTLRFEKALAIFLVFAIILQASRISIIKASELLQTNVTSGTETDVRIADGLWVNATVSHQENISDEAFYPGEPVNLILKWKYDETFDLSKKLSVQFPSQLEWYNAQGAGITVSGEGVNVAESGNGLDLGFINPNNNEASETAGYISVSNVKLLNSLTLSNETLTFIFDAGGGATEVGREILMAPQSAAPRSIAAFSTGSPVNSSIALSVNKVSNGSIMQMRVNYTGGNNGIKAGDYINIKIDNSASQYLRISGVGGGDAAPIYGDVSGSTVEVGTRSYITDGDGNFNLNVVFNDRYEGLGNVAGWYEITVSVYYKEEVAEPEITTTINININGVAIPVTVSAEKGGGSGPGTSLNEPGAVAGKSWRYGSSSGNLGDQPTFTDNDYTKFDTMRWFLDIGSQNITWRDLRASNGAAFYTTNASLQYSNNNPTGSNYTSSEPYIGDYRDWIGAVNEPYKYSNVRIDDYLLIGRDNENRIYSAHEYLRDSIRIVRVAGRDEYDPWWGKYAYRRLIDTNFLKSSPELIDRYLTGYFRGYRGLTVDEFLTQMQSEGQLLGKTAENIFTIDFVNSDTLANKFSNVTLSPNTLIAHFSLDLGNLYFDGNESRTINLMDSTGITKFGNVPAKNLPYSYYIYYDTKATEAALNGNSFHYYNALTFEADDRVPKQAGCTPLWILFQASGGSGTTTELKIKKIDESDNPVEGVKFILTPGTGTSKSVTTNTNGNASFLLGLGSYTLTEEVPSGSTLIPIDPISFSVTNENISAPINLKALLNAGYTDYDDIRHADGINYITNQSAGAIDAMPHDTVSLVIEKEDDGSFERDNGSKPVLSGYEFKLLYESDGKPVRDEDGGAVVFADNAPVEKIVLDYEHRIPPTGVGNVYGTWELVLRETRAPDNVVIGPVVSVATDAGTGAVTTTTASTTYSYRGQNSGNEGRTVNITATEVANNGVTFSIAQDCTFAERINDTTIAVENTAQRSEVISNETVNKTNLSIIKSSTDSDVSNSELYGQVFGLYYDWNGSPVRDEQGRPVTFDSSLPVNFCLTSTADNQQWNLIIKELHAPDNVTQISVDMSETNGVETTTTTTKEYDFSKNVNKTYPVTAFLENGVVKFRAGAGGTATVNGNEITVKNEPVLSTVVDSIAGVYASFSVNKVDNANRANNLSGYVFNLYYANADGVTPDLTKPVLNGMGNQITITSDAPVQVKINPAIAGGPPIEFVLVEAKAPNKVVSTGSPVITTAPDGTVISTVTTTTYNYGNNAGKYIPFAVSVNNQNQIVLNGANGADVTGNVITVNNSAATSQTSTKTETPPSNSETETPDVGGEDDNGGNNNGVGNNGGGSSSGGGNSGGGSSGGGGGNQITPPPAEPVTPPPSEQIIIPPTDVPLEEQPTSDNFTELFADEPFIENIQEEPPVQEMPLAENAIKTFESGISIVPVEGTEDEFYILDEEGIPLGVYKVPPGKNIMDIDEFQILDELIPLGFLTFDTSFKMNPETGNLTVKLDYLALLISILALAVISLRIIIVRKIEIENKIL